MLSENVKKYMEKFELSVNDVCWRSGLSKPTIYNVIHGKHKKCNIVTYKALAKALNCSVSDLIN